MKQLKPRLDNLLIFLSIIVLSTGALIWIVRMLMERPYVFSDPTAIIAYLGFAIIILLPLILSCWYLYVDLSKKVIIDEKNKAIIIRKGGKDLTIAQNDILDACIIRTKQYGNHSIFTLFRYVIIVLRERRRFFITNLLCEPEYILNVLGLKMNVVETAIPFFDFSFGNGLLTTKEFESKVMEYERLFQDHTDKMLHDMILGKETYADCAREAAKRILEKRQENTNAI